MPPSPSSRWNRIRQRGRISKSALPFFPVNHSLRLVSGELVRRYRRRVHSARDSRLMTPPEAEAKLVNARARAGEKALRRMARGVLDYENRPFNNTSFKVFTQVEWKGEKMELSRPEIQKIAKQVAEWKSLSDAKKAFEKHRDDTDREGKALAFFSAQLYNEQYLRGYLHQWGIAVLPEDRSPSRVRRLNERNLLSYAYLSSMEGKLMSAPQAEQARKHLMQVIRSKKGKQETFVSSHRRAREGLFAGDEMKRLALDPKDMRVLTREWEGFIRQGTEVEAARAHIRHRALIRHVNHLLDLVKEKGATSLQIPKRISEARVPENEKFDLRAKVGVMLKAGKPLRAIDRWLRIRLPKAERRTREGERITSTPERIIIYDQTMQKVRESMIDRLSLLHNSREEVERALHSLEKRFGALPPAFFNRLESEIQNLSPTDARAQKAGLFVVERARIAMFNGPKIENVAPTVQAPAPPRPKPMVPQTRPSTIEEWVRHLDSSHIIPLEDVNAARKFAVSMMKGRQAGSHMEALHRMVQHLILFDLSRGQSMRFKDDFIRSRLPAHLRQLCNPAITALVHSGKVEWYQKGHSGNYLRIADAHRHLYEKYHGKMHRAE